jgi:hypothetical protein
VDNFFGQWLQTRNVWLLTPDTNTRFPWFDDNLRAAFVRETELFLDDQLKADRSIVELLSADSTFLNEQLARHYGVRGVYGSHSGACGWRTRTAGASWARQASWPSRRIPRARRRPFAGSGCSTTSSAAPVPAAPPDVNTTLEEHTGAGASLGAARCSSGTAPIPVCASCHARMDPLGFSLEHFDALGQWRHQVDGESPINANGVLLDGTTIDGPAACGERLLAQREQFVRAVTAKLLTYAVGREIDYGDAPRSAASFALPPRTTTAGRPRFWRSSRARRSR